MPDQFERTRLLIGEESMRRLKSARVAIFGVGGVGGYSAEALARMGVGAIDLYDNDTVSLTNLNRQIAALHSTIGLYKADVMADRIREINPNCRVQSFRIFYLPDSADEVDLSVYDYVVDAIDTVAGKLELIVRAKSAGVRIICAMGAANKMDPTQFVVMDIHKTEMDPLARVLRKELRARGIKNVKVVCSKEAPISPPAERTADDPAGVGRTRTPVPASNAFVPPVCGLVLAGEVVKDLIDFGGRKESKQ